MGQFVRWHASADEDVEDAVSEIFVQAYRSVASFRGESSFGTWLYSLARNVCRGRWRRQAQRRSREAPLPDDGNELEIPDARLDHEGALQREEARLLLRESVEQLPAIHREVLHLKEWEGLSYDEIARALDVPVGTVRSRLHNATALLTRRLKPLAWAFCLLLLVVACGGKAVDYSRKMLLKMFAFSRTGRMDDAYGQAMNILNSKAAPVEARCYALNGAAEIRARLDQPEAARELLDRFDRDCSSAAPGDFELFAENFRLRQELKPGTPEWRLRLMDRYGRLGQWAAAGKMAKAVAGDGGVAVKDQCDAAAEYALSESKLGRLGGVRAALRSYDRLCRNSGLPARYWTHELMRTIERDAARRRVIKGT
jgi:RNA polymerase sigma-70 factor (ECF subfamily)